MNSCQAVRFLGKQQWVSSYKQSVFKYEPIHSVRIASCDGFARFRDVHNELISVSIVQLLTKQMPFVDKHVCKSVCRNITCLFINRIPCDELFCIVYECDIDL